MMLIMKAVVLGAVVPGALTEEQERFPKLKSGWETPETENQEITQKRELGKGKGKKGKGKAKKGKAKKAKGKGFPYEVRQSVRRLLHDCDGYPQTGPAAESETVYDKEAQQYIDNTCESSKIQDVLETMCASDGPDFVKVYFTAAVGAGGFVNIGLPAESPQAVIDATLVTLRGTTPPGIGDATPAWTKPSCCGRHGGIGKCIDALAKSGRCSSYLTFPTSGACAPCIAEGAENWRKCVTQEGYPEISNAVGGVIAIRYLPPAQNIVGANYGGRFTFRPACQKRRVSTQRSCCEKECGEAGPAYSEIRGYPTDGGLLSVQTSPCNLEEYLKTLPAGWGYYWDPLASDQGWCKKFDPSKFEAIEESNVAGRWAQKEDGCGVRPNDKHCRVMLPNRDAGANEKCLSDCTSVYLPPVLPDPSLGKLGSCLYQALSDAVGCEQTTCFDCWGRAASIDLRGRGPRGRDHSDSDTSS